MPAFRLRLGRFTSVDITGFTIYVIHIGPFLLSLFKRPVLGFRARHVPHAPDTRDTCLAAVPHVITQLVYTIVVHFEPRVMAHAVTGSMDDSH